MDALRLSLLLFGAFAIGGIYLWSSHVQHKRREQNIGWEGPDSHTVSDVVIGDEKTETENENFSNSYLNNFDTNFDRGGELLFTTQDAADEAIAEKIFTQDIASESIHFNDTGEFASLSDTINEVTRSKRNKGDNVDTSVDADNTEDDPQTPSIFVKPKVYQSKLDETRSHIKAVHQKEQNTASPSSPSLRKGAKASGNGLVIVINLLARPGLKFKGEKILRSVENSGLKYGEMDIFHFTSASTSLNSEPDEASSNLHMFSLTNIVNPGTFDKSKMSTLTTPGLSLFMQLPGPEDGIKTFEKMLNIAQNLKKELDGELCDETRSALTYQTISHLKERIKEYCFKYQHV